MSDYTQDNRLFKITTPLGKDKLLLKSVRGVERLSSLFEYEVRMLSEDNAIDCKKILGKDVTITIASAIENGGTRYINGIVRSFGRTGNTGTLAKYVAIIVPKLWLTTLTADSRIFQKKTAKAVLSELIKTDAGITDYKDSASDSGTAERAYCVQYRETDYAFACRLMEEEGIYYHFNHADGKHTLVLCDSPGSHSAASDAASVSFHNKRLRRNEQGIQAWGVRNEVVPGNYVLADYNYQSPSTVLRSNATESRGYTGDDAEIFDYPGMFTASDAGEKLAKIRLGSHQARHATYVGATTAVTLSTGTKFTLEAHPAESLNAEYLVTENEILAENPPYTDGEPRGGSVFESRLVAISADQQYRPPQRTPVPDLRGPHSAVVTGSEDDEIHTDKYGCVKVKFHWDRDDQKKGEDCTVYLRTAQMWTGKNWGTLFIPRVGQEVIVEFLDGHPDRPVITACLYNEENLPPYALPDHKTRSTIKTHSTPEGEKYNEIRFEDKKDEEQLLIHAAKDHEIITANDRIEQVGRNSELTVMDNLIEFTRGEHHEKIGASHFLTIGGGADEVDDGKGYKREKIEKGGHQYLQIEGERRVKIGGNSSLIVSGEKAAESFEGDYSTQVTGNRCISAEEIHIIGKKNITLEVGGSYIALTADGIKLCTDGEIFLQAGKDITVKTDANIAQTATGDIKAEATGNMELKGTGGVKVESAANVEVKATAELKMEGAAGAALKGSAQLKLEGGAMAELKAGGILTLQGAMVNIN